MDAFQEKEPLLLTIAVLGRTGKEGKGLAYRWAAAGYEVLIGSHSSEKAVTAASEIMQLMEGSTSIVGTSNLEAAQLADIVVLSVPYAAHRETLEGVKNALKGKILIDVTVPLVPPKVTKVQMPEPQTAGRSGVCSRGVGRLGVGRLGIGRRGAGGLRTRWLGGRTGWEGPTGSHTLPA